MHIDKKYDALFEFENQKFKDKPIFKDGIIWDEVSFGILTDNTELEGRVFKSEFFGHSNPTRQNTHLKKVKFQIHQSKEIASMLQDHYTDNTKSPGEKSLELEAGHEYIIYVSPTGTMTTEGYKALSLENRQCKLEHKVEKSSLFNIYTKNN